MSWSAEQRARLVDVIHGRWWQSKTAPIPGHHVGKDLSICKRLIEREGWDAGYLADVLAGYDGPPATLRVFYRMGGRALLSTLDGALRKRDSSTPTESETPDGLESAESVLARIMGT